MRAQNRRMTQQGLFDVPLARPRWQDLDVSVREKAVSLLAQMLREHCEHPRATEEGVGHE